MPNQYDEVRIIELRNGPGTGFFWRREPQVGDIAFVVEKYANPPGYDLECVADDGRGGSLWLTTLLANEVVLELVRTHPELTEERGNAA